MISIPLFCRRSLLVRADGSAVDYLDIAVIHHPIPDAGFLPSHKAIVASGARTMAFGQVAPWSAGSQHPEDAIQHAAIIDMRHASGLVGQQGLDFEVG